MHFINQTAAQQAAALTVLMDKQTRGNVRLMALTLAELVDDQWSVTVSIPEAARFINSTRATSRRALRALEEVGVFEVDRSHRPFTYSLVLPLPQSVDHLLQAS